MPLYDFHCRTCGHDFEALVRPQDSGPAPCPSCGGSDLDRQLPTFAVSYKEKTMAAAAKSNAKRAAQARRDNIAMEAEIERHRQEEH
jgi:putative FmdB family regulatory protein